jgi:dipeptidyl aminopeptidase/acylaminoacyl peptidase
MPMGSVEIKHFELGKPRRLTAGLTSHEHPAISPDGQWLACYAGEYGSIETVVCDLRGRLARRVSPHGGNNTQPAWHPSSLRVVYRHQHDNTAKWELWETELPAGQAKPLLADPQWHYKHPSYSPDGRLLAYFSDEGTAPAFNLWVMELASGTRRQVTFTHDCNFCHPVFSPDGKRLAFHAYAGTDENVTPAVVNLAELELGSGEIRWLTLGADQCKHPFYLSSAIITFHHERNTTGVRYLSALHIPSGKRVRLTSGENNDKHPFPHVTPSGKVYLAWASKHLGPEVEGEQPSYDIFLARLKGYEPPKLKNSKKGSNF